MLRKILIRNVLVFLGVASLICSCSSPGNRGIAYLEKGKYDLAISSFNEAIKEMYFFDYIDSNRMIGGAHVQVGTDEGNVTPKYAMGQYLILQGKAYYLKGEYDKAWDNIHEVQKLGFSEVNIPWLEDLRKASGRQR